MEKPLSGGEKRRDGWAARIPWHGEAMGRFFSRVLHRGGLERERVPNRCNELNTRRMAVLWTCRTPFLSRHMCRELLRNELFDFTPIITSTHCQQSNYVERYSKFKAI